MKLIEYELIITFIATVFSILAFTGYGPFMYIAVFCLCVAKAIEITDRIFIDSELKELEKAIGKTEH
jgi:hypothetical protein